jgi:hypothetical protein
LTTAKSRLRACYRNCQRICHRMCRRQNKNTNEKEKANPNVRNSLYKYEQCRYTTVIQTNKTFTHIIAGIGLASFYRTTVNCKSLSGAVFTTFGYVLPIGLPVDLPTFRRRRVFRRKQFADFVGSFGLHGRKHMRISIHRRFDASMSESFLCHLRANAG